jgi:short-subunit dehydrogenase
MTSTGSVLLLGATSDMARAAARAYAARGRPILLAARNPALLATDIDDLRVRYGVTARAIGFDILDTASHPAFLDATGELPQTVVCAVGLLGEQVASQTHPEQAEVVMRTNYLGPALLLDQIAQRMETRGSGVIIGISSVAGDRGRASNYCYGSAKAGFSAYLSGLRNRLARKGVHVITVKPGFVRTRMTEGMKLPGALTAEPEEVAAAIIKAEDRRSNTVYARPIWRWVMLAIIHLPEAVFKRLSL